MRQQRIAIRSLNRFEYIRSRKGQSSSILPWILFEWPKWIPLKGFSISHLYESIGKYLISSPFRRAHPSTVQQSYRVSYTCSTVTHTSFSNISSSSLIMGSSFFMNESVREDSILPFVSQVSLILFQLLLIRDLLTLVMFRYMNESYLEIVGQRFHLHRDMFYSEPFFQPCKHNVSPSEYR